MAVSRLVATIRESHTKSRDVVPEDDTVENSLVITGQVLWLRRQLSMAQSRMSLCTVADQNLQLLEASQNASFRSGVFM